MRYQRRRGEGCQLGGTMAGKGSFPGFWEAPNIGSPNVQRLEHEFASPHWGEQLASFFFLWNWG